MRRSGPIKSVGKRGERLKAAREANRELAMMRDTHCENCGMFGWLEAAHAFGRGNKLSEPVASWPECLAMLCRPCHVLYDNEAGEAHDKIIQRIGWHAVVRLRDRTGITLPMTVGDSRYLPLHAAAYIERELRARGEI